MKQVYLYVGGGVAEITPRGSERKNFVKLSAFGQRIELEQEQAREAILAGVALLTEKELAAIFNEEEVKAMRRGGREGVSRFDPANPEKSNAINLKLLKLDEAVGKSRKEAGAADRQARVESVARADTPKPPRPEPKPVGGEN